MNIGEIGVKCQNTAVIAILVNTFLLNYLVWFQPQLNIDQIRFLTFWINIINWVVIISSGITIYLSIKASMKQMELYR